MFNFAGARLHSVGVKRIPRDKWCHVHVILTRFTAEYYVDGDCFAKVSLSLESIPPVGFVGFYSYSTPFDVCNVIVTVPEKAAPAPSSAAPRANSNRDFSCVKGKYIVEVDSADNGSFSDIGIVTQVNSDGTYEIQYEGLDKLKQIVPRRLIRYVDQHGPSTLSRATILEGDDSGGYGVWQLPRTELFSQLGADFETF